jgi:hypothetical protein
MPFPLIAAGLVKAAPAISTGLSSLFGHHESIQKKAKSADELLAGWKHPIPDNYVPFFNPQKGEWDWTFSLGASSGRDSTTLDPNVARSQDQVKQWTAAGIPVTCDANGICSRTDGGGQSATPTAVPDAGAASSSSGNSAAVVSASITDASKKVSDAVNVKAGGQPIWIWVLLGLGLLLIFRR